MFVFQEHLQRSSSLPVFRDHPHKHSHKRVKRYHHNNTATTTTSNSNHSNPSVESAERRRADASVERSSGEVKVGKSDNTESEAANESDVVDSHVRSICRCDQGLVNLCKSNGVS